MSATPPIWPLTREVPPLPDGTVHVWRLRIDVMAGGTTAGGPEDAHAPHLTDEERARAARFRQAADQRRFAWTRSVLRSLLGTYRGQAPQTIVFGEEGSSGKPTLAAGADDERRATDLRFNVSHAHEWALIALARGCAVGIDVEYERPLRDLRNIAQRFFAPPEAAIIEAAGEEERLHTFYRIWTRKEAFVKATGAGIAWGLDRFTVSHGPGTDVTLAIPEAPEEAARWTITGLPMERHYAAALAVQRRVDDIQLREWTATANADATAPANAGSPLAP